VLQMNVLLAAYWTHRSGAALSQHILGAANPPPVLSHALAFNIVPLNVNDDTFISTSDVTE